MVYYVLMDLEMFLIQLSDDKYHKQNYKESNHTIADCSIPVNFTSHIALWEFKKSIQKKNIMHKMHH